MKCRPKNASQPDLALGPEAKPRFEGGGFVTAIRYHPPPVPEAHEYPFNIPAIRSLDRLELHPAVTFFVGENGSGKSTLLEAMARKLGFNPEGGGRNFRFSTRETHSSLHESLTLERVGHFTDNWFLRAESFYNVASQIDDLGVTLGYGGKSLHAQSHGEAFLALLTQRLQGDGVYLFDEPEAALSPQRQLSVLTLIHRLVYHRSQLVIATHSPILLSCRAEKTGEGRHAESPITTPSERMFTQESEERRFGFDPAPCTRLLHPINGRACVSPAHFKSAPTAENPAMGSGLNWTRPWTMLLPRN